MRLEGEPVKEPMKITLRKQWVIRPYEPTVIEAEFMTTASSLSDDLAWTSAKLEGQLELEAIRYQRQRDLTEGKG